MSGSCLCYGSTQCSLPIRNTDGVLIDEALGIFESTIRSLITELEAAL